jgi:glycosyltransferase involved in cell wall biosynthesis
MYRTDADLPAAVAEPAESGAAETIVRPIAPPVPDAPPSAAGRPLRVAIVHEWLVNIAGSEKVVAELLGIWPQADLFAVVDFLSPAERAVLGGRHARTTFIQRLPGARRHYKAFLPLMPLAIEQLDLGGYDLVVSSNHAVAKGVITSPDQLHVSYVHSPMRYAWDLQHEYLRESGLARGPRGWAVRCLLHRLRQWDHRAAAGVDFFVANSRYIARRIEKAYRRDATVIHPPVDVAAFAPGAAHDAHGADDERGADDSFYLAAGRLVPYKRVAAIVEAFAAMPARRLVVIGDGPELGRLRALATPNVRLLGYQPFDVLRDHMQRARAFVFAAEEDFGIAPVEAQACGTPVIAYGRGGALDSVRGLGRARPTGMFFHERSPAAIRAAIEAFETLPVPIAPADCRAQAERFSAERFRARFAAFVEDCHAERVRAHREM